MLRPAGRDGRQARLRGDPLDVARDRLRFMLIGDPWTSRRLDVHGHETRLEAAVVVDAHSTEHGVYGLRMKRREVSRPGRA